MSKVLLKIQEKIRYNDCNVNFVLWIKILAGLKKELEKGRSHEKKDIKINLLYNFVVKGIVHIILKNAKSGFHPRKIKE